jgi:glycosyltransferase involved in cell wall biosynthesis
MVKKGHEVTLYATGDSQTLGRLRWICPRSISEDPSLEAKVYQYLHTALVFEEANQFDLIHNHYDAYPLAFSKLVKTPILTTIHGFSSPQVTEIYRKYSQTFFVSISLADRIHAPTLNYAANIYHGIPLNEYKFNDKPENYFCYLGRISPDKGVHQAIKLAKKLGLKFKIAGLVAKENRDFFNRLIKPNLNPKIKYLGLISEEEKKDLLQKASGFLHLNTYSEGFGLTLIEAMACGTPVIGMNLGSVPEVIEDKKTGFVISSLEEAGVAVKQIETISRIDCRKRVEKHFSVERMVNDYEKIYIKILKEHLNNDQS